MSAQLPLGQDLASLRLWEHRETIDMLAYDHMAVNLRAMDAATAPISVRTCSDGPPASLLVPLTLPVLQRLGDVWRVDEVGAVEVGDGAADLEHSVIGAGGEV